MMSPDKARKFSEKHFPQGPEKLAKELGILVREGSLKGCDGWVLSGPAGIVIRLNDRATPFRRRFTLAHEISHLLLGIPTVVGETIYDSLKSDSVEERNVNSLASELLLPESVIRQRLTTLPVIAARLKKIAKFAHVSELAVAIRVTNLAKSIGLVNASVAFFKKGKFEWNWSQTLTIPPSTVSAFLEVARKCHPQPARIQREKTNDVVVASIVETPGFVTETLFIQILPKDVGSQLSKDERRIELEKYLFKGDEEFRMSLQGVFGAFRPKCSALNIEQAFKLFFESKGDRWNGNRMIRLRSANGQEYVRLRLSEWCK